MNVTKDPIIISNLVNNFPNDWNRHEDLTGKIDFNYAFSSSSGGFDPAKTSMFGYELNTPLQVRKSWYRAIPASDEYLTIDNQNIILLNLKSVEQGFIIRLLNVDSQNDHTAKIKSKLITGNQAHKINLLGQLNKSIKIDDGVLEVSLKAGEFSDILINSLNK